ncbi:hypothetical protein D3C71_2078910 [compost metagenome]
MHTSKCEHDQAILLMLASSRQRALRPRLRLFSAAGSISAVLVRFGITAVKKNPFQIRLKALKTFNHVPAAD